MRHRGQGKQFAARVKKNSVRFHSSEKVGNKIEQKIDERLDEKIDDKLDEKIDDKLDEKIDYKIGQKIDETIVQELGSNLDHRIEVKIDEKMDISHSMGHNLSSPRASHSVMLLNDRETLPSRFVAFRVFSAMIRSLGPYGPANNLLDGRGWFYTVTMWLFIFVMIGLVVWCSMVTIQSRMNDRRALLFEEASMIIRSLNITNNEFNNLDSIVSILALIKAGDKNLSDKVAENVSTECLKFVFSTVGAIIIIMYVAKSSTPISDLHWTYILWALFYFGVTWLVGFIATCLLH